MINSSAAAPTKVRDYSLDIVRIFAFLSVICVHFFMNSGFYTVPIEGKRLFFMTIARTFFMVCVPLFIVLTGYLMSKKTLSRGYYKGIVKTLFVYVIASILCLLYKKYVLVQEISAYGFFAGILGYTGASYAWYIEMYIGLFLIIPFLNGAYASLAERKHKKILIATFIFLTALPGVLNIYLFNNAAWWGDPKSEWQYTKLIPSFWTSLYPVTYYFIGAYVREYGIRLRKRYCIPLLVLAVAAFGSFNYWRSRGTWFISGIWQDWGALPNVIMTVILFVLLLNFRCEKAPNVLKRILSAISDCCLGAYLLSYIFDQHFYAALNEKIPVVTDRIEYFVPAVAVVAVCSLALSWSVNLVYAVISALIGKVKTRK